VSEGNGSNYRSDYTNDQLYKLVRRAAFKLSSVPEKLSTRQFDAGREALGEPNAPSARWIAKRLGKPWPELVKLVCNSDRDLTMSDAAARRAPAEKWLDLRHLYFALRYVAEARGERSFPKTSYDTTRAELLQADQRRSGGTLRIILPTSGQIIQIVRRIERAEKQAAEAAKEDAAEQGKGGKSGKGKKASKKRELLPELDDGEAAVEDLEESEAGGLWNKALVLADLEPYVQQQDRGVPWAVAIHLYIEATGKLPKGVDELKRLAKEGGFSLAQPKDGNWSVKKLIPEAAAHRATLGLPMADEFVGWGERPVFDLAKLPADLPPSIRKRGHWLVEGNVIEALVAYLDTCEARNIRQPTVANYKELRKGRRGEWPSPSAFIRHGGFPALIEKATAQRKRRKEAKAA
jgi:hypothetical protein